MSKSKGMKNIVIVCTVIFACVLAAFAIARVLGSDDNNAMLSSAIADAITDEYALLIGYEETGANPLIDTLYEGFVVEVHKVKQHDNQYVAHCTFSNYDIPLAMDILVEEKTITYESYYNKLVEILKKQPLISCEVEINVSANEDETFCAYFTEDQLDKAMGGFLSYYWRLQEEG